MTGPETTTERGPMVDEFGQPIISETLRHAGLRSWLWAGISIFAVIVATFPGTLFDLVVPHQGQQGVRL